MKTFNELLESVLSEIKPKPAQGKKLGGGIKVKHDADWKMAQKKKKKWAKTSAGKKSLKKSKIRTGKASYRPKERQGVNRAKTQG